MVVGISSSHHQGNPAAVCWELGETSPEKDGLAAMDTLDPAWMARVAAEMNLSETAFVAPCRNGFALRWFTPTIEVDLCGHATLAAAHILWEEGLVALTDSITFHTRSGPLTVSRETEMTLHFPALPVTPLDITDAISDALGTTPVTAYQSDPDCLLIFETESDIRQLSPNMNKLTKLPPRGWICTAKAESPDIDFVSRFFAPRAGIPEDPFTGSAHCVSGPYWAKIFNRSDLTAEQCSAQGGLAHLSLSPSMDQVYISGQARTTLRDSLLL